MKKKVIIALTLLMICMSSCVYSLFPIYTTDTLVYLPELVGKWQSPGDDEGDYIEFTSKFGSKDNFTISIDFDEEGDDETLKLDGFGQKEYTLKEIAERLKEKDDTLVTINKNVIMSSDITTLSKDKMNYRMTVYEDGEKKEQYEVHVVRIGEDLFMDLYPYEFYELEGISDNFFPVHTFLKMEIKGNDKFDMVMFDLDKLNRLFESNLIRMRHENVDGTVLITAQPKEIQKFLKKYSDDESVFDETINYQRISAQ